jgi:predicted nuclease of predicted toxin-antitoxin system
MKVLLDVGISPRLRAGLQDALDGAPVESAVFRAWRALRNSELIEKAHQHGFTTLVTSDKRLAKEQRHLQPPFATLPKASRQNNVAIIRDWCYPRIPWKVLSHR